MGNPVGVLSFALVTLVSELKELVSYPTIFAGTRKSVMNLCLVGPVVVVSVATGVTGALGIAK